MPFNVFMVSSKIWYIEIPACRSIHTRVNANLTLVITPWWQARWTLTSPGISAGLWPPLACAEPYVVFMSAICKFLRHTNVTILIMRDAMPWVCTRICTSVNACDLQKNKLQQVFASFCLTKVLHFKNLVVYWYNYSSKREQYSYHHVLLIYSNRVLSSLSVRIRVW